MTDMKSCPKCGADLPAEPAAPKKSEGSYIRTISGEFLNQTLYFYIHAIELQKENPTGKGINRGTSMAVPAYILAAAGM